MRVRSVIVCVVACACNTHGAFGPDASPTPPNVTCSVDASGIPVASSSASGTFSANTARGSICKGGAFAYLERTVYGQLLVMLGSNFSAPAGSDMQFDLPANATDGDLSIMLGVDQAAPGTYTNAHCGDLAMCVYLPVPPNVDCADASGTCPPGCSPNGPISDPTCAPTVPNFCFSGSGASSCAGASTASGGWKLVLTSVSPSDASDRFEIHGTLDATLARDDGTPDTLELSMAF